jgi:MoaA/NifB/PqqE/SkfB family radical SAM enzyme
MYARRTIDGGESKTTQSQSVSVLQRCCPGGCGQSQTDVGTYTYAVLAGELNGYRSRHPALFIAVPRDEDDVGGCLSAGRGFIHINAAGDVEPCPFAPFSDVNLRNTSLRDALRSPLLSAIRDVPELARETGGGCILWKERERVQSLLQATKSESQTTCT